MRISVIERFFNGMARDDYKLGIVNRIHALEVACYIQGHSFLRQPKAFTLSSLGVEALSEEPKTRRPEVRDAVSEALIRHDLKVAAVGLVLTKLLGLPAWREHPQIVWAQSGGRRQLMVEGAADIWIDTPAAPKAVEVELTQKSRKRYVEIFETYRRRLPHNGVVLYLTGWPQGIGMILRNAREDRAPFVYACGLDEFRLSAGRALFQGAVEDRRISLAGRPTSAEAAR
jgi:hypothetical protein